MSEDGLGGLRGGIISISGEVEVAAGSLGITAERSTIEVEAEAGCEAVVNITNGTGSTSIGIRSGLLDVAGSSHTWSELDKERL